jgi:DNA invertase Pin-like site-specific DNA recombinase
MKGGDKVKKAYGYLRVSGSGQVKGDGFPRQEKAIRDYAKKCKIEVVAVFKDDVSGTKGEEDRPAFQEMVSEILKDGVRTIIVEGLDRLAREYHVQETLLIYLASKDIELLSARTEENVTEAIMADPMRKALVQIQGIFAELEKNLLVKKLIASRERIRATGVKCGGRKGYRETEEGKAVLRKIRALRRKTKDGRRRTWQQIADILNAEGVKTMDGQPWTLYRCEQITRTSKAKPKK